MDDIVGFVYLLFLLFIRCFWFILCIAGIWYIWKKVEKFLEGGGKGGSQ